MKKFMLPAALLSAAAIAAACSTEIPTDPAKYASRNPSLEIGVASAAELQVCIGGSSPGSVAYKLDASNVSGLYGTEILNTGSNQDITPGNCIVVIQKTSENDVPLGSGLWPPATVTSVVSANAPGSWEYSCVSPEPLFCPAPPTGSGNTASSKVNFFHGSTITFSFVPEIVHTGGCTYTQGYYKNHKSYVVTSLASGGTWIVGGKLDVSGGLDRSLATAGDNFLDAAQVVTNLNPKYAEAPMRQLITAELNIARGAETTAAVDAAVSALRSYYAGSSASKSQLGAWNTTLDKFNNGNISGAADHCD